MAGFESPLVLAFLACVPALYAMYRAVLSRRRRAAIQFSSISYLKSAMRKGGRTREASLFYASVAAIALMIVGFAGPHIPLEQAEEGVNVVLVIDISGSMAATDYPPSRLEAAKRAAGTLVGSLEPNDNVGIVTFESGATTAAYLSPYKDRVGTKLGAIRVSEGRTAIGDGLSLGIDMATSVPNKKKVVILLSDGVSNSGVITPAEAIAFAASSSIQVHTVGMGSEGRVVLGYDAFGRPQYAELDEATLRAIASQTGGSYFKSVSAETLEAIYRGIGDEIEREEQETDIREWFFAAALAALAAQLYMRYGRGRIIQ